MKVIIEIVPDRKVEATQLAQLQRVVHDHLSGPDWLLWLDGRANPNVPFTERFERPHHHRERRSLWPSLRALGRNLLFRH